MKETFQMSDLQMLARDCLTRAGVSAHVAGIVARDVALSEATGRADCGFAGLLRDIRLIRYGRLSPDATAVISNPAPSVIEVDAAHGFAAAALAQSLPALVDAARAQGVAMLHLTRASNPGAMAGAMAELAASDLAALGLGSKGQAFAIRPQAGVVTALDSGADTALSALLSEAPPIEDSPLDGPVEASGWLTALDPGVTAAAELLRHLPLKRGMIAPTGVSLAPELLAQIVNA
ncbi:Ldh family oxidoreductase [Gymnodinialimonas ceratoperidinii]|uniref:Ldh family oxidoreductase n=1 Tax=Gymnodinialimonas ceratoperidinii TaxID=2856823 RepID=A0A8F6YAV1_9RHOB|nr:Ldh family oxidoreductase [Gymnodinialimonas ceratoperidinii]QXT39411.1 Ldh family oxidoreductase [Gymnodinialimonas ceratoperidinii]